MSAKIGDLVRFLNDVGGGTIVKINGNMAYVADEDGFETPILLRECVVVGTGDSAIKASKIEPDDSATVSVKPQNNPKAETASQLDTSETDYGDKINIAIGFEPHDLKRLSATSFDAWLVNDSNYFLYFTFMSREDSQNTWQVRHAGSVEPNTQLPIAEFTPDDLHDYEQIAFQAVAFKRDRVFSLKMPIAFESRLDTTKFAKLHCFKENIYFDYPVIAVDIVKDDKTCKSSADLSELAIINRPVEKQEKTKPLGRRVSRRAQKNDNPDVIDLHADQLLDNLNGLSNADILNYQIDTFRKTMDENLMNYGCKLVFIHGKGDGVLRQALLKELNYRYPFCSSQDASFREYGYGATLVTINKKQRR